MNPPAPLNVVYVASASVPSDAVVAGTEVAYRGGVLLLGDNDQPSADFLTRNVSRTDQVILIGPCSSILAVSGFSAVPATANCTSSPSSTASLGSIPTPSVGLHEQPWRGALAFAMGATTLLASRWRRGKRSED